MYLYMLQCDKVLWYYNEDKSVNFFFLNEVNLSVIINSYMICVL